MYDNFGVLLLFQFMFGDLKDKKIAFCLEVGGGWLAAIKLGGYFKGFIFKIGYNFIIGSHAFAWI